MACEYALHRNPGSVLFVAQQGPEKYMKALLTVNDPLMTEDQLRNKFGHKLPTLFGACVQIERGLEPHRHRITMLDYGPRVRYHSSPMMQQEAVDIIDLAHDLCQVVALHLLRHYPRAAPVAGWPGQPVVPGAERQEA
jgi:hypothetical protein